MCIEGHCHPSYSPCDADEDCYEASGQWYAHHSYYLLRKRVNVWCVDTDFILYPFDNEAQTKYAPSWKPKLCVRTTTSMTAVSAWSIVAPRAAPSLSVASFCSLGVTLDTTLRRQTNGANIPRNVSSAPSATHVPLYLFSVVRQNLNPPSLHCFILQIWITSRKRTNTWELALQIRRWIRILLTWTSNGMSRYRLSRPPFQLVWCGLCSWTERHQQDSQRWNRRETCRYWEVLH